MSTEELIEVVHWDGRLDNREDLKLRLRDLLRDDTSDTSLARASYERWGVNGLVQLIGDWSLVIRDRVNRTTVLASDFAGVRPLYYHVQREGVLWSNRLQDLVEATKISELDEQYLAWFLIFSGCPNHTPYKDIHSVPPGHAVIVSSDETKICRFWELPVGDAISYRSERRYEEQLHALFREAVAVRLQTEAPVLAELSGGLDSSSVVCMANELIRSGAVNAKQLSAVSFIWQNSLDEPFIHEVESHCGIEGVHLSTHEVPLITEKQVGRALPEAFEPLRSAVAAIARERRVQTILTGQNGDLMLGNWYDDSLQVAALLRSFRPVRAFAEALSWSKLLRRPVHQILWRALQAALPPSLTPETIYTTPDGSYAPKSTETSLVAGISERLNEQDLFSNTWRQAVPERRKYFHSLTMTLELRDLQTPESLQHLDYTHPFAHRPLVEFLMTVPTAVLCGPGEPRRLMRASFADLWPARLRERRSKGVFNAPWQEALRPLARVLLEAKQLHLVDLGIVDHASVRSRLERLCVGLDCNASQLRQIVLLELWLHNRDAVRSGQLLKVA